MSKFFQKKSELTQSTNCPTVGYQKVTVCTPVTIKPFARVGRTTTYCCGDPVVTKEPPCSGTPNGSCTFNISQELCIAVPVVFGAKATHGDTHVQCGMVSEDNICTDCSTDD